MSTKNSLFSLFCFLVALKGDFMGLVERIKQLSNQRKVSIAELERYLGFSNSSIRKWDERNPGVDKLNAVADYFDVSTDYLLGRTNVKNSSNGSNEVNINDNTIIMTLDGDELTESERQVILAATRALIEQRKKEGKK